MLYQGSDGRVHVLGDGEEIKHWKYIKKIKSGNGWRYFYSQDEINAYMKEVQGVAKGVKNKIDSIPRLEKHGSKYYIADKKTQRNIEKSGVGGNTLYRNKKGDIGSYKNYKVTKNAVSKQTAKDRMDNAKGKEALNGRKGDKSIIGKTMSAAKAASEMSKIKARESAYEKYEAKNVLTKPFSSVKKKAEKKINKGKKKIERKINNTPITTSDIYVNGKKVGTETYTIGDARKDYKKAKKTYKQLKKYYGK